MGFFALHESLWPAFVCHAVATVSSLLLAILVGTLPAVFTVSFSNGFEDILHGEHDSRAFSDSNKYFLITEGVLAALACGSTGLLILCGILNERPKGRAVVFYIEVFFGILSFVAMCILANKSRQLEGPIFFRGLLKGWEKGMDMNACERAVDTQKEVCETSLDHLDNCSGAQAQVIASAIFAAFSLLSLIGSAAWMCFQGVVQIDSLFFRSNPGPSAAL